MKNLGKGLLKRPASLKAKDRIYGATTPFDWSKVQEDAIGNVSGLFGISDQDQGRSLTCTIQTMKYGFKYVLGLDISIKDIYPFVRLAGGGAYLNAPLDLVRKKDVNGKIRGVAPASIYPDPVPETEENMKTIINVQDGDRIRTFELSYTFYPETSNIDSAAFACQQHDYIHLGIDGSNPAWANMVDPIWDGVAAWGHALFACKESICLRKGIPAIKARSSWCSTGAYCHYLNKNYFPACFEIIGVDIKELDSMKLVNDNGTVFLVGEKGKIGIADEPFMNAIASITDLKEGSTAGIPQIKVIESNKNSFVIKEN